MDLGHQPGHFTIYVLWGSSGTTFPAAGTARSLDIPVEDLPLSTPLTIYVFAYNDGSFTGPAGPDSDMNIRAESTNASTITITSTTPVEVTSWGRLIERFTE